LLVIFDAAITMFYNEVGPATSLLEGYALTAGILFLSFTALGVHPI
jgi:hypothetical protein